MNKRILYNNGNYKGFNTFLNDINWEKELLNLEIDKCYTKFLSIYEEGCKKEGWRKVYTNQGDDQAKYNKTFMDN